MAKDNMKTEGTGKKTGLRVTALHPTMGPGAKAARAGGR